MGVSSLKYRRGSISLDRVIRPALRRTINMSTHRSFLTRCRQTVWLPAIALCVVLVAGDLRAQVVATAQLGPSAACRSIPTAPSLPPPATPSATCRSSGRTSCETCRRGWTARPGCASLAGRAGTRDSEVRRRRAAAPPGRPVLGRPAGRPVRAGLSRGEGHRPGRSGRRLAG